MTAIQLHLKQHVGTTYKRALERFHHSRDAVIPRDFSALPVIEQPDNWSVRNAKDEDEPMRKPRDFDAELKALGDKARQLKDRKLHQMGELVIATGADALAIEQLAGLLLAGVESKDAAAKEAWRKRGFAFFQRSSRAGEGTGANTSGAAPGGGNTQSGSG